MQDQNQPASPSTFFWYTWDAGSGFQRVKVVAERKIINGKSVLTPELCSEEQMLKNYQFAGITLTHGSAAELAKAKQSCYAHRMQEISADEFTQASSIRGARYLVNGMKEATLRACSGSATALYAKHNDRFFRLEDRPGIKHHDVMERVNFFTEDRKPNLSLCS